VKGEIKTKKKKKKNRTKRVTLPYDERAPKTITLQTTKKHTNNTHGVFEQGA
jgi:hypothetical protein